MSVSIEGHQRRAILQQRIEQRHAQWYEQYLLRLEVEAAGLLERAWEAERNMQALERELESLGGE